MSDLDLTKVNQIHVQEPLIALPDCNFEVREDLKRLIWWLNYHHRPVDPHEELSCVEGLPRNDK